MNAEQFERDLRRLAGEVAAQAQIASRVGQMETLERIARELEQLTARPHVIAFLRDVIQ